MDNDAFTKGYFKLLAAKLAPHSVEPKQFVDAIWVGTAAMVKNDGTKSNEEVFWKSEDYACCSTMQGKDNEKSGWGCVSQVTGTAA